MTATRGLSTPTIQVNDQVVPYLSGTLEFKDGRGETMVRPQTTGGRGVSNVITRNTETQKSMVKFSVATTQLAVQQIDAWLLNNDGPGNTIRLSGEGTTRGYRNCFLTNDPSFTTGSDGTTEVIFEGDIAG